jgi:hypothetical protein
LGSTLALKSHQQNRISLIEIANVANPHPGGAVSRSVDCGLGGLETGQDRAGHSFSDELMLENKR